MQFLTVALPKGRLLPSIAELFEKAGCASILDADNTRKLVLVDRQHGLRFILAKPTDVPTYVEHGAADIGIAGKDVIMETQRDICELLDLGIGYCKLVVAVPASSGVRSIGEFSPHTRVATSFPSITRNFFNEKGLQVEIIELHGSIELAPIVGLADAIVDITSSGQTLRENNLVRIADVRECTARLIANRVSYKVEYSKIDAIAERLDRVRLSR